MYITYLFKYFALILSNNIYTEMLSRLHCMNISCCPEAKQAQPKAPTEN